ncbi:helix-turn-helix transcriptional regulator [Streptomyces violascens]|uniref:AraC family transcriptional regulator n=1 Tax=Streptomyces violascens TaxID=67381 RepID=A0ABQ3QEX3_9ACTN|nr:AraC family transcriptional regulator [Streptomyces violascens]GGU46848.1 AraC family transcriptional regulator [Streptomyces violascens]GHI35836.1 AraC family transcriptional regulator [Streptomyces violascens]
MVDDQLSEALDLVEVRGVLSSGIAERGPWVARVPAAFPYTSSAAFPLKFLAMVRGRARLSADGVDGSVELEPGDVAILNRREWLEVEGGVGDGPRREILPEVGLSSARLIAADSSVDDLLIGGRVELNPAGDALLLEALPPLAHIRAAACAAGTLRGRLDSLFDEVTRNRMGSAFAIRQHAQLLLLEVLRAYIDQAELPPGWLRALTDQRLRPALRLMHAEPGRHWGLEELAREAAMSRTTFAERFRAVAGVPPLAYLSRWRMLLARRALRDRDIPIRSLAAELGYASESAFSNAFKREVGESPLRHRHRVRGELTAAPAEPAQG